MAIFYTTKDFYLMKLKTWKNFDYKKLMNKNMIEKNRIQRRNIHDLGI